MFSISESMSALSYDFIYLVSFGCSSLSYFLTFIFFFLELFCCSLQKEQKHIMLRLLQLPARVHQSLRRERKK